MLSRLLYVPADLLRRCWPFFGVYFALFAALTLFDGLSLALFVQRVGAESLPAYQAVSAVCVICLVLGYVMFVDRMRPGPMFLAILAPPTLLLLLVWGVARWSPFGSQSYGLLFVGRDAAFALVLLHFGTFLQEFFTREELCKVIPLIYAGGRVGGIVAAAGLQYLSPRIQPLGLLPVTSGILVAASLGILWIRLQVLPVCDSVHERTDTPTSPARDEEKAIESVFGFIRFVFSNSLMFWIAISTIVYFVCRTYLAFRYNQCFDREFSSEVEMAAFLGAYTKYALAASLLLQLFFVNRWLSLVGLKGAHLSYAGLLVIAATLGSVSMTLASAVCIRLVESELRYCLRNPAHQMTLNLFSKPLRIRARAWSMGFLIPGSTLAAALSLSILVHFSYAKLAGILALAVALCYLAASNRLVRFVENARNERSDDVPRPMVLQPAACQWKTIDRELSTTIRNA